MICANPKCGKEFDGYVNGRTTQKYCSEPCGRAVRNKKYWGSRHPQRRPRQTNLARASRTNNQLPTINICEESNGNFLKKIRIYFSKCSLGVMGRPKEVCLLMGGDGLYISIPTIDSKIVHRINPKTRTIGMAMNEHLQTLIGRHLLEKVGDKFYLEKMNSEQEP